MNVNVLKEMRKGGSDKLGWTIKQIGWAFEINGVISYTTNYDIEPIASTLTNSTTVESLLNAIIKMPKGSKVKGTEIAALNHKFSKVSLAITSVEKISKTQAKINATGVGNFLARQADFDDIDGAIFEFSSFTSRKGVQSVHIKSETAQFIDKPLELYINDDSFSIDGYNFYPLFKNEK